MYSDRGLIKIIVTASRALLVKLVCMFFSFSFLWACVTMKDILMTSTVWCHCLDSCKSSAVLPTITFAASIHMSNTVKMANDIVLWWHSRPSKRVLGFPKSVWSTLWEPLPCTISSDPRAINCRSGTCKPGFLLSSRLLLPGHLPSLIFCLVFLPWPFKCQCSALRLHPTLFFL